jgi:probable addiction module antidote protein
MALAAAPRPIRLHDRAVAAAFLNSAARRGDVKSLLRALRSVVDAQGGVGALAKRTRLARAHLYRTLSPGGNPEVKTLETILAAYGMQIGCFPTDGGAPPDAFPPSVEPILQPKASRRIR